MTIPVLVLLGFAAWTVIALIGSVGAYCWSHILTGKRQIGEFQADAPVECEWYRRAMRAHMNCVENLPLYGAVVVAIVATGADAPLSSTLSPSCSWLHGCARP